MNATKVEEAALVLAVTPQHAATLRHMGQNPAGGIYTLPESAVGARDQGSPVLMGLRSSPTVAPCDRSTSTWSARSRVWRVSPLAFWWAAGSCATCRTGIMLDHTS